MPTRLGQKRIKSSDPAYQHLEQQLKSRMNAPGEGYTFPNGGIPRTDMTQDVQIALGLAEKSYQKPLTGIATADLDEEARTALIRGSKAYIKPTLGIPESDLSETLRTKLAEVTGFYTYPEGGIPKVDLHADVQEMLQKGISAYHKPATGIPETDLSESIVEAIHANDGAYKKPSTGIPLSDLEKKVVESSTFDNTIKSFDSHVQDTTVHITDHKNLKNIGRYAHKEIDDKLDDYYSLIRNINYELSEARDDFASIGARIDATIGKNSLFTIDTADEWKQGTFKDLGVNSEGNVSFDFPPEPMYAKVYKSADLSYQDIGKEYLGAFGFNEEMYASLGSQWLEDGTKRNVAIELNAYIYIEKTGDYVFGIYGTGNVRLQVAGQLIIDEAASYNFSTSMRQGSIRLEGGRLYRIVAQLIYFDYGARDFGLYWQPPNRPSLTRVPVSSMNMNGYQVNIGIYESHVIDLLDNEISQWFLETDMLDYRTEDDVLAYVSTSEDGLTFSPWMQTLAIGEIHAVPTRYIKIRLVPYKHFDQYTPLLRKVQIRYVSSGANIEYIKEIIDARDSYLRLKDRFESIESKIQDVSAFYATLDKHNINPEYFASVRLGTIELNMLNSYLNNSFNMGNYMMIEDGIVDNFQTLDGIDLSRSGTLELRSDTVVQKHNRLELKGNTTWSNFALNKLAYTEDTLRLGFSNDQNSVLNTFSNTYYSATSNDGRIGRNYQRYLAQAFYTGQDISRITRLRVYRTSTYRTTYEKIQVVPALPDGNPDFNTVLFSSEYATGIFENISIPVLPKNKYFIIISFLNDDYDTAYSYYYLTNNNSNSNDRLRGNNPGNETLLLKYSTNRSSWSISSYFLRFEIDEVAGYAPQGTGEYVYDFMEPKRLLSFSTISTLPAGSNIVLSFQSSNDQINWSTPVNDITETPYRRFLKINVEMTKGPAIATPLLKGITVNYVGQSQEIISKPIELSSIPTHVLFMKKDSDEHISYFASRDDGYTWQELKDRLYTDLHKIQPGKTMRIKAVYDGEYADSAIDLWAALAITQRDISTQNVTALFEEYEGFEEGQVDVILKNPYPLGTYALNVYLNGILQSLDKDYEEINEFLIRFTEPLQSDDRVTFKVNSGAYGEHDVSLVERIKTLESITEDEVVDHDVTYEYDDEDRIIRAIYNGTQFRVVRYLYDLQGRKFKEVENLNTQIITTEFEFDGKNRIVKKKVTHSEVN